MKTFEHDTYLLKDSNTVTIEFYGHASFMIDYGGTKVYVDPVSDYADYSLLPKADLILITHEHYDHFDAKAINNLLKENTQIVSNPNTINLYGRGETLKNGESTQKYGIDIIAFSAYNTTLGRDKFHPKGRDNGYLLTKDDFRIYISGDTETVEDNDEIKNCNVLFLAVNQPYTMTIKQAAEYAEKVAPEVFYPYHTTDTDMKQLEKEFEKFGFKTIIHDMK